MSNLTFTPIAEGSAATPGLWNSRFQEIVASSSTGTITPLVNDVGALGSATSSWADLFLASGGVINFGAGGVTITHDALNDRITIANGDVAITSSSPTAFNVTGRITSGDFAHTGASLGFYGTSPIVQQSGVAVSAAGIHTALVNLGLIAS